MSDDQEPRGDLPRPEGWNEFKASADYRALEYLVKDPECQGLALRWAFTCGWRLGQNQPPWGKVARLLSWMELLQLLAEANDKKLKGPPSEVLQPLREFIDRAQGEN